MKKSILIATSLVFVIVFFANAAEKRETKKTDPKQLTEEKVPLVTEVMSKEELQAYLKEKGIPNITRENFKEPELLWDRTFDEWIREISDITETGNCMMLGGPISGTDPNSSLLFITNKGETRQKIKLGETKENNRDVYITANIAKSGNYATVFKVSAQEDGRERLLSYYEQEGKLLWTKTLDAVHTSILSYNGEVLAVENGNPKWDEEEWQAGNKNINRVRFYNYQGKLLSEYNGFRNFSQWVLSDDGKYFAAFVWWMDDKDRETGSLILFDVYQGKILWQKPLKASHWLQIGGPYSLAISEMGNYLAVAMKQVEIFNRDGKSIVKIPGKKAGKIRDDGFCSGGDVKGWIDVSKSKSTGLIGSPPYFLRVVDIETVDERTMERFAKSHRILSKEGEVLWEKEFIRGNFSFTKDWHYLVGTQYIDKGRKRIIIYKLVINPPR